MAIIVVSADQNVVVADGVRVVAVPVEAEREDDYSGCDGCYFNDPCLDCRAVPCNSGNRDDELVVIFKKE